MATKPLGVLLIDPCPLTNADLASMLLAATYVLTDPYITPELIAEVNETIELLDEIISARLFMARLAKDLFPGENENA